MSYCTILCASLFLPPQAFESGFHGVQVNVDARGKNIPGDAANEPSIAIDPTNPNNIVIGWRQFDTVGSNFRQAGWAYSHDGGKSWTFPGVLEPGVFGSDPVLDSDSQGNFYYYTLASPINWKSKLWRSTDAGQSWHKLALFAGGDKPWMQIDKTGNSENIYLLWNYNFKRSTDHGRSFEAGSPPACQTPGGSISIGPEGQVYVYGDGSKNCFAASTNAQNPLERPVFDFSVEVPLDPPRDIPCTAQPGGLPNPNGMTGQAWVASNHSTGPLRGEIYILQSVIIPALPPNDFQYQSDVMFARSVDGGLTWSEPMRLNTDPSGGCAWQWFGTLSVASNGRIDAVWNDTRNSGQANLSQLYYTCSFDGGRSWLPDIPVTPAWDSHIGWPDQNKIGDYYQMISDDRFANLAYAATFNGEQDVYFLKIPAPNRP